MTGRELIVYILENNLENENIFNPGEDLEGCIFIREDRAAADCGVGVVTIKAWCAWNFLDFVRHGGCIYILKNKKYEEVKRWEEI